MAGAGWPDGIVGAASFERDSGSTMGLGGIGDRPVVIGDLCAVASAPPELLREHHVRSLAGVPIQCRRRSGLMLWGAFNVQSTHPHRFTNDELGFISAVARMLALAIDRAELDRELRQRDERLLELSERVRRIKDDRRLILSAALSLEDRAREQVAQILHDEALQSLLAARQDLAAARASSAGRPRALAQAEEALVEAIDELRGAVTAVHPVTLTQRGLVPAIAAIADLHAKRGGFALHSNVDPHAAGEHDQLVVSLARELLNNVVQHAQARQVTITLQRMPAGIVFEVLDDGRGLSTKRARRARQEGHVGLASARMRVESVGGRLELSNGDGRGTRVRVVLPSLGPSPSSPVPGYRYVHTH